ncbi:MAG: DUF2505 domain-containing protein [Myxococcota bacterium]|jgi:Protein of unknown function (DUF2505)|nr:DUF2505 domain-containing protein [Myxococcota bacterium]
MLEIRVDHTLECSEDVFWDRVFLDDEYNRGLFVQNLKFTSWRELRRETRDGLVHRVVEAVPPVGDVPAALKAVIGQGAGYEERGVLDRAKKTYKIQVVPNRLADKVDVKLEISTSPVGEGQCRRSVRGTISAKIPLVGGILEKKLLADLEKSYAKSVDYTNRFAKDKGQTAP